GFPPKAFGITVGETEYCLSWLPLGGYVKIAGMADFGTEQVKNEPWEFQSKPKWMQMSVMIAGPAMNFLLGFLLILVIRLAVGDYVLQTTQIGRVEEASPFQVAGLEAGDQVFSVANQEVANWQELVRALRAVGSGPVSLDVLRGGEQVSLQVSLEKEESMGIEPFLSSTAGSVVPGYPAEQAGIQTGDQIVSVDGEVVRQWSEMREQISAHPGEEIEIRWIRDGQEMSARVAPRPEQEGDRTIGLIGIGPSMEAMARVPVGVGTAITRSGQDLVGYTTMMFMVVKRLVMGEMSGRALAGPVGIAQMAGSKARQGWESLFDFMAMLSINLAVLNLLPIPALDGGHLMILSIEAVIRRPLSVRQKEVLQQAGFAFLMCLMLYVTFGDLGRIFGWN
ncbi:MAG: RIP metalloprotease RseP, partial [bacterium]|nr:RIP metalloprotease RseP [bacterium]